jgi:hypothetical protein
MLIVVEPFILFYKIQIPVYSSVHVKLVEPFGVPPKARAAFWVPPPPKASLPVIKAPVDDQEEPL